MDTSAGWMSRMTTAPTDPDWQRLVSTYSPLLDGWLTHAGVPTSDRDDLRQDVLLAIVRQVSQFEHRGRGAFRAWLRGIVANRAGKYFRDRKVPSPCDLDAVARDDGELAKQWDREYDEHLAAAALKAIEPQFAVTTWDAFRRQVLHRQKPAEVATATGLSLNSVLLAKSRVLKRLRAELRDLVDADG